MIARATLALMLAGPAVAALAIAPHEAQAHSRKHVATPASHPAGDRVASQPANRRNRRTAIASSVRHAHRRDMPAAIVASAPDAGVDDGLAYDTPRDNDGRPVVQQIAYRPGFVSDGLFQTGTASWYGGRAWVGHRMSDGSRYNENALTAAHASLPLGSLVRVVLADTDRAVVVRITDRPGTRTRVIDLSRGAAAALGILSRGVAVVRLEPL